MIDKDMADKEYKYFKYGKKEIDYLKAHDPILGLAMDEIGLIEREITPDLFEALINSIVGQQISSKALKTVWARITEKFTPMSPETIASASELELQNCGLSFRKVEYMKLAAKSVIEGSIDLNALNLMSDEEVCMHLIQIKGIGRWTAEMLMIFSMQRPDIFSYDDLAIIRGLRMLYHHRKITPKLFAKYKRRYSPYSSVASLYLWAIAGGACPKMKDYAPSKK